MKIFNDFQVVRDEEITFFMPKGFGDAVDNDIRLQRQELVDGCLSKLQGYHIGHTLYSVLTGMGLVEANKVNELTRPTTRGMLFLKQELGIDVINNITKTGNIRVKVDLDKYLRKYLESFLFGVTGKSLEQLGMAKVISEYCDKGRSHASSCCEHGIALPHVSLIFMLSKVVYDNELYNGSDLTDWIIKKHDELKDSLPPINLSDQDILYDPKECQEEY